jgi:hypothetical protein
MRSVGFFNGIDLGKLRADWKAGQAVQLWTDPIALSKAVAVEIWLMAWMAGWLILQLRRPRLWLDRVGQVMGLNWVAMIPANLMHFFWHSGWSN